MMSRFPKITETFILYEMLAVMKHNIPVEIYPLMREHTSVMHPEAVSLVEQAHFTPHISLSIVVNNLWRMFQQPGTYFKTLFTILRANWGSRRFFINTLMFFPKSVYLGGLMQKAGITHLHAHFASFPAATAYIVHQLTGIPYSFTAHGSDLHRDKHMLCEKIEDAKFVVAISQYNEQVIREQCNETHNLHIIHCGVDTEVFKPVGPSSKSDGPLQIVCIGTLHEVKGQTYLIRACEQLKARDVEFVCHLVADGPDEQRLKEQVNTAGLSQQVIFHGRLPQTKVIRLLSQADVVAAPSVPTHDGRREGIPVALMEAMAFGIPVVASDLSGIPELVDGDGCGVLVPPRDVAGIANALETLAKDPALRQTMGAQGREKILRDFNLDENARLLSELFQEAVT